MKVLIGIALTIVGLLASAASCRASGVLTPETIYAEHYSSLQAAINATTTNKKLVATGTYNVGIEGLQIEGKTDVVIDCEGRGKITATAIPTQTSALSSTKVVIRFDSNTRTILQGCRIDGAAIVADNISVTRNTYSAIRNISTTGGGSTASITAFGNTGMEYSELRIDATLGSSRGLWVGGNSVPNAEHYALIKDNRVSTAGGTGIVMQGDHLRALSNRSNGSLTGSGLIVSCSSVIDTQYVMVSNNFLQDNFGAGFQSDCSTATDYSLDVVLTGNVASGNTSAGMYVVGAKRWTITGNSLHDNATGGMVLDNASSITVTGNSLYDSRVAGARTQTQGIAAVAATGNISDISIVGNTLTNNTTIGMHLGANTTKTMSNVLVSSNLIRSNSTHGLHLAEADVGSVTQVVISNNISTGNTTSDLRIDPADIIIGENVFNTTSGAQPNLYFTFANADTTPSVAGRKFFRFNNSGATTVTMFDDGTPGQEIFILCAEANTTMTDGGNLKLNGGFTCSADDIIRLVFTAGVWYEQSRSVN